MTSDSEILGHIRSLVDEEHQLRSASESGESRAEAQERLKALEVQLDQCWDLLRQRRARMEFGENPDEAHVRPAGEVEGYLQ